MRAIGRRIDATLRERPGVARAELRVGTHPAFARAIHHEDLPEVGQRVVVHEQGRSTPSGQASWLMQALVRDLNLLYRLNPALHVNDCRPEGFEWLEVNDAENSILAFVRKGRAGERLHVVVDNKIHARRPCLASGPSGDRFAVRGRAGRYAARTG